MPDDGEDQEDCPMCGAPIKHVVGEYGGVTYDGIVCEGGCNLWDYFG